MTIVRKLSRSGALMACLASLACSQDVPQQTPTAPPTAPGPATTETVVTPLPARSATASVGPPLSRSADPPPREVGGPLFARDEAVDLIIADGTVYDGGSGPPLRADVVIDGDSILHVGQVDPEQKADRRIDAKGLAVAPGFIDLHSHGAADASLRNFLSMGVTTICLGQDGKSPENDRVRTWSRRMRRKKLAVNVAPFVGHGTVRNLAGAGVTKTPTAKQLSKMSEEIERDLEAGAWGLTTGLEYTPGRFATLDELIAIAKPVAASDGVIMSHMRSEDDDAIDAALDELIAQGEQGGARVHVSHLKVVYGKGEARAESLLQHLRQARQRGVSITADLYPYNASYTTISIVFPDFAKPPNAYKRVKREQRDELAEFLRNKVEQRGGPQATLFGTAPFSGQTLAEVAKKKGKPFEDVLIDDIGPGGASAAYFVMDDALQARLLRDPIVLISTDGGPYSSHPRGYGAFAKVIQEYVVKRKVLSLGAAIHKMTGGSASVVGLDRVKRGRLETDWAADVVVFDPKAVEPRSTYERPRVYAHGMSYVVVNGRVIIDAGDAKKRRAGRLLLKPSAERKKKEDPPR